MPSLAAVVAYVQAKVAARRFSRGRPPGYAAITDQELWHTQQHLQACILCEHGCVHAYEHARMQLGCVLLAATVVGSHAGLVQKAPKCFLSNVGHGVAAALQPFDALLRVGCDVGVEGHL